jgi:hypothetical protein
MVSNNFGEVYAKSGGHYFNHLMNSNDYQRFTVSKCKRPICITFNPISQTTRPSAGHGSSVCERAFYLAFSRVKCHSDVMIFGTDKFPEHGRDFRLNRLIEEMDHALEYRMSFESRKPLLIQGLFVSFFSLHWKQRSSFYRFTNAFSMFAEKSGPKSRTFTKSLSFTSFSKLFRGSALKSSKSAKGWFSPFLGPKLAEESSPRWRTICTFGIIFHSDAETGSLRG